MPDQGAEIPSPLENLQLHGFKFYASPTANFAYPYENCKDRLPDLLRDYLTATGQQETGKIIEGDEIVLEEITTEDQSFFGVEKPVPVTRKTYYRKTTHPMPLVDGLKDRVEVIRGEGSIFCSTTTQYTYALEQRPMGNDVSFLTAVDVFNVVKDGSQQLNAHVEYEAREGKPEAVIKGRTHFNPISPVSYGLVPIDGGRHTKLPDFVRQAKELAEKCNNVVVAEKNDETMIYMLVSSRGEFPENQFEFTFGYRYRIVDGDVVEWGYIPDMATTQTKAPYEGEAATQTLYTYINHYPTLHERYDGGTKTNSIEFTYYTFEISSSKPPVTLRVYNADERVNDTHYKFEDLLTEYIIKEDDIANYGHISVKDVEDKSVFTRTIILPSFDNQRLIVTFPVLGEGNNKKLGDPTKFVVENIPPEPEN